MAQNNEAISENFPALKLRMSHISVSCIVFHFTDPVTSLLALLSHNFSLKSLLTRITETSDASDIKQGLCLLN